MTVEDQHPKASSDAFDPNMAVSLTDGAAVLGCSVQTVLTLARTGHVQRSGRGLYPLADLVQGRHRRTLEEQKTTTKSAAVSKAQEARARQIDLAVAREERELVPLQGAIAAMDEFAAAAVLELKNLPARFTRDVALRRELQAAVNGSLEAIADKMKKSAEALSK